VQRKSEGIADDLAGDGTVCEVALRLRD